MVDILQNIPLIKDFMELITTDYTVFILTTLFVIVVGVSVYGARRVEEN